MNRTLAVLALLATPIAVAAQEAPAPDTAAASANAVRECLRKCPEGVRPPQFTYFPQMQFVAADVGVWERRLRTFLAFQAIVGADGTIEPESLQMTGGTARSAEQEVRRGLAQSRFRPGTANGGPVRTRVSLRFDFEAEGTSWIKYTYRVVAR